ncbi:hypothetical protein LCGC14_0949890 [marine sediment metagenome]|uniref:Uncharacterized protein n=1 Tax=marine sediment metagenome TaxID=412755 RepID=A0A0F9NMC5_9ZZZZ
MRLILFKEVIWKLENFRIFFFISFENVRTEMVSLSLRKMMEDLKKRNVLGYDEQTIMEDIKYFFS